MGSQDSPSNVGTQDSVLERFEDGVLVVTINRPEKYNAFDADALRALIAIMARAAKDEATRAILLTGAGKAFCAGQDLGDRAVAPGGTAPDLGESLENRYNPLIRAMRAMPKPIICAVNGVAAGAGANIALAADIALAAKSAKFIQAFAKLGLVPDSGGTWFLPRLIGEARARALMLLADPIDAEQAERWGMIHGVVEDSMLMEEAMRLARKLADGPTYGYSLIKKALNASPNNDLDRQLDLERDLQRQAGQTSDYQEGVRAFVEKRAPRFKGAFPVNEKTAP